jgi:nitrogen fixation/metabolism regulation signal transduction histidine kinase
VDDVGVTPGIRNIHRLIAAGLAAAALAGAAGYVLEQQRFGADDEETVARIERELADRFDAASGALGGMAARVAERTDLIRGAGTGDQNAARALFAAVAAAIPRDSAATGLTVYDSSGQPIAWAGRVSDLPTARVQRPAALFVAPGALGPRLVRVEAVASPDRAPGRLGTIVVEQILSVARIAPGTSDTFVVRGAIAPVVVTTTIHGSEARTPYSFVVPSRDGEVLVQAVVSPDDIASARRQWRARTVAVALSIVSLTVLVATAPLIAARERARSARQVMVTTAGLVLALAAARLLLQFAIVAALEPSLAQPLSLLLWALFLAALVWLAFDLVERRRVHSPRIRLHASVGGALVGYVAAGAFAAALLWAYGRVLQNIVSRTTLDLLHFSIHPLSAPRLALSFGLIALHAGVLWAAALVVRLIAVIWRHRRGLVPHALTAAAWVGGAAAALAVARRVSGPVPIAPLTIALAAVGLCAAALTWPRGRVRRSSQAVRLVALFTALALPALAMYPLLHAFTTDAKDRLVAGEYSPAALRLRDQLQQSSSRAREEIDALPSLSEFLIEPTDEGLSTDAAYQLWSKTDLAAERLTSAVELYAADGRLVSRFFLNLPEYATPRFQAAGCGWDIVDESSPIGSSERHVLRASRGICERGRMLGSVAVRVMLDYRTLPFISARTPYLESLRAVRQPEAEDIAGRDVEFVLYGWSRAPLYVSATSAFPLPDAAFRRMAESRERFWDVVAHDGRQYRVYYASDRGGIYAFGYPLLTPFGHIVNLAELVTLAFVLYMLLLAGSTLFNLITSYTPASGRALLREIRSSFYRKLFLAFVLVAVLPVVILAFATRTYFAAQFTAGVEEAAVETATVAQRLVEDYATLQQRQTGALQPLDDSVMVVVGRAIDQAVNLFEDAQLQATSERDLFASRLLPTRTPAGVYQRIVLDRMPTYVGVEEIGGLSYLVAAAPVRTGGRAGVVTVPQTLQRQQSEQQRDELDRLVLSALVLFVLLGAGFGYGMAERIADPVNRLTRATRRIARGDLDARIAARSSDELRRLVDDFNRMAADLKQQRAELERSQRLEAWAEMARQVAHDIKNPLTPIQLSAEHARRINLDRGRPLSPVLDDCVSAILTQVKLLRQISAEFSSFASSPTPRPEPTNLASLIDEVVLPYRTALAGRIAIEVEAAAALPELRLDRTLFSRALTNVIENALHAMPGNGTLTIQSTVVGPQSSVDGRQSSVVVRVRDTGVGMDPEAAARIFEPYFSTKATGTGLGLTIAKRNIELNGGTIAVDSARGAGTTVTITLPI